MSRLVVPQDFGTTVAITAGPAGATAQSLTPDDYKERLIKYIPAETIAFYTFIDKLIASHYGLGVGVPVPAMPDAAWGIAWLVLLLGLVGTPIYLWQQRIANQPWVLHAIVSTIAFAFWAYTLGGTVFLMHGWYDVFVAGLLAPIFTFVAGFMKPKPG